MHKLTIEKRYSLYTGVRFAAVTCSCGQRVDVCTRAPRDGERVNAWGDRYPIEETRAAWIKAEAERRLSAV